MRRTRASLLLALAIALAGVAPLAAQEPRAPLRTATLRDVAFIAGRWEGELDGGRTEEWWTPAAGDNMTGMFRYVKDGSAVFYELMTIERTAEGPVLRLRHFGPGLVAWEEKEGATVWPLVELGDGRAVFELPDGEKRLVYRRAGPSALTVTLEKLLNGAWTSQQFAFTTQP